MSDETRIADDSIPVGEMLNLGPTSAAWLREVGIQTADDLKRLGAVAAFLMVKTRRPDASLNLLYALHGAITGTHWAKLPAPTKDQLKRNVDTL